MPVKPHPDTYSFCLVDTYKRWYLLIDKYEYGHLKLMADDWGILFEETHPILKTPICIWIAQHGMPTLEEILKD